VGLRDAPGEPDLVDDPAEGLTAVEVAADGQQVVVGGQRRVAVDAGGVLHAVHERGRRPGLGRARQDVPETGLQRPLPACEAAAVRQVAAEGGRRPVGVAPLQVERRLHAVAQQRLAPLEAVGPDDQLGGQVVADGEAGLVGRGDPDVLPGDPPEGQAGAERSPGRRREGVAGPRAVDAGG